MQTIEQQITKLPGDLLVKKVIIVRSLGNFQDLDRSNGLRLLESGEKHRVRKGLMSSPRALGYQYTHVISKDLQQH